MTSDEFNYGENPIAKLISAEENENKLLVITTKLQVETITN